MGKRKIGYKGIFVYLSFWNLLSVIYAMLNLTYHSKKKEEKIQPASTGSLWRGPVVLLHLFKEAVGFSIISPLFFFPAAGGLAEMLAIPNPWACFAE